MSAFYEIYCILWKTNSLSRVAFAYPGAYPGPRGGSYFGSGDDAYPGPYPVVIRVAYPAGGPGGYPGGCPGMRMCSIQPGPGRPALNDPEWRPPISSPYSPPSFNSLHRVSRVQHLHCRLTMGLVVAYPVLSLGLSRGYPGGAAGGFGGTAALPGGPPCRSATISVSQVCVFQGGAL